jgi:hypothetical protein
MRCSYASGVLKDRVAFDLSSDSIINLAKIFCFEPIFKYNICKKQYYFVKKYMLRFIWCYMFLVFNISLNISLCE